MLINSPLGTAGESPMYPGVGSSEAVSNAVCLQVSFKETKSCSMRISQVMCKMVRKRYRVLPRRCRGGTGGSHRLGVGL